jgi:hypothetical protein
MPISITLNFELSDAELKTIDRVMEETAQSPLAADLRAAGLRWGREEELIMQIRGRLWELRRLHATMDNVIELRTQQQKRMREVS